MCRKYIVESKGKTLLATSSTKIITSNIDSRCIYITILREIKICEDQIIFGERQSFTAVEAVKLKRKLVCRANSAILQPNGTHNISNRTKLWYT